MATCPGERIAVKESISLELLLEVLVRFILALFANRPFDNEGIPKCHLLLARADKWTSVKSQALSPSQLSVS